MKKLLVLLFILLLCIGGTEEFAGASPFLKWDAVMAPEGVPTVTGYAVYFYPKETAGEGPAFRFDAGNVTIVDLGPNPLNLTRGIEYEFYVVAYNSEGEGGPSNKVPWTLEGVTLPTINLPPIIIKVPPSSTLNITIENE